MNIWMMTPSLQQERPVRSVSTRDPKVPLPDLRNGSHEGHRLQRSIYKSGGIGSHLGERSGVCGSGFLMRGLRAFQVFSTGVKERGIGLTTFQVCLTLNTQASTHFWNNKVEWYLFSCDQLSSISIETVNGKKENQPPFIPGTERLFCCWWIKITNRVLKINS